MSAIRMDGPGVRPTTPKPVAATVLDVRQRRAPASDRPIALQRQIVEALGLCKLSLGALVVVADIILPEPAPPPGAEDQFRKVRRALAGAGNLQAQLIDVIAYERLRDATLRKVAAALVSTPAAFDDEEIANLRLSLRGQRS